MSAIATRRKHNASAAHSFSKLNAYAFETALGWMALAWREAALTGATFGHSAAGPALRALLAQQESLGGDIQTVAEASEAPAFVRKAGRELALFAAGKPRSLAELPVALEHLTEFQRKVIAACRAIPWGEVRTYGELADQVGHPGAARAVGTVMSSNRYPLIIPCHRVVGSAGGLGGYSAPDGLSMKRRLLLLEQPSAK